jgi:crotonobetainyl-CoA:carnitine CoA-transferase CaiB-like acyl-CoA transferase
MTHTLPLTGIQVLELSDGVSGAYCAKMLADAGASVVTAEPPGGSPLRRWRASRGTAPAVDRPGPLFGYLAAGKGSVTLDLAAPLDSLRLLPDAGVIVTDGTPGRDLAALRALLPAGSAAVVASITNFGEAGPHVAGGVQANDLILQAMCGSIGGRGWPGEEPFQAGGRVGEWVAGAYAAVAVAACLRRRRITGRGDFIDVSAYEAMVVTMGVSASVLGKGSGLTQRSLELPSIVPTADGLVGFCTITAQQFSDFLVLIGRADLVDDRDLASAVGRRRRRDEFLQLVHSWAATRTTAEIIELAATMRIPVAPVGTPETVTGIDHFRARGVFVQGAGGYPQPRVPYRSDAFQTRAPGPAPRVGQGPDRPWEARPAPMQPNQPRLGQPSSGQDRPLEGVRIADFTAFWAGPMATQILAALGADVVKIEGLQRPDGMRYSGGPGAAADQWWESGPVFLCSNNDKRGVTLELSLPEAREIALKLIAASDVVIENFSPRVMGNLRLEWDAVSAANPQAVMVRMPAFGLDGPWRDRVGFAQTMEQATGMAWMTGYADGPPVIPQGVCDPIAGLHAAFATIVALEAREQTGQGMQVESTMVEAALNVAAEALLERSAFGVCLARDGNRGPGAAPQGVYRAAGADDWVAVALLDDEAWPALGRLIGRPDLADDPRLGEEPGRLDMAAEIDEALSDWMVGSDPQAAVRELRATGVAAARVVRAAELLDDVQLQARGFWEKVTHPVAGTFLSTAMPFRLDSVPGAWLRASAPLLGQHNAEILAEAGLTPARIAELAARGVIGTRPAGL